MHLPSIDIAALIAVYGYWAVFAMIGLESMGVPLPGETTLIAAAAYAGATHHLSIELVVLAAIAGAVIGDNIGYTVGNVGGYRLLLRYGKYIRIGEARIKLGHYIFAKYGGSVVFFGRFVSVLRAYAALLAGITHMPWRRFFFFNAAGGTTWALIYGVGAYLLGDQLERLARPAQIAFAVIAVIAIVIGLVLLRRSEQRLEALAEREYPGPLESL
jgi:membrane protein DedA with SNARE-associated domain